MFESVAETLVTLAVKLGLPALALIFYLKGAFIGKPIPASILLPGYVIAVQPTGWSIIIVAGVCTAASVIGEVTIYHAIKQHDVDFLNRLPYVTIDAEDLTRVNDKFAEYGGVSILIGSAIPGIRGTILIPAALASYPAVKAAAASFVGTSVYHLLLIGATLGLVTLL